MSSNKKYGCSLKITGKGLTMRFGHRKGANATPILDKVIDAMSQAEYDHARRLPEIKRPSRGVTVLRIDLGQRPSKKLASVARRACKMKVR